MDQPSLTPDAARRVIVKRGASRREDNYDAFVIALPHGQPVAVGSWRPTTSTSQVLVEQWNGTAWHMARVPTVPGFSGLYSVAAAPGQGPWASGFSVSTTSGGAVFLQRVGGSWQQVNPPPVNQAFAVAGASDGDVWTVYYQFIAHGVPR
jgi:hypothetical protein